jgi:hypothetical protein
MGRRTIALHRFTPQKGAAPMRLALVLSMVCVTAGMLSASTRQPVDVAVRAKAAGRIVVATVSDVESGRFDVNQFGDRVIVTRAWLQVDEVLKGPYEPVVAVDLEGGSIGDLTLRVSDMPSLQRGERALFFLNAPRAGGHAPNGRGLGILKLDAAGRVVGSTVTLADLKAQVRAALQ